MSERRTLPPARERHKGGIRPQSEIPPAQAEALFDRVAIKITGSVTTTSAQALDDFITLMGVSRVGSPLFGKPKKRGQSWQADIVKGSTISAGRVSFARGHETSEFTINVTINPMRTLSQLLDQYQWENIPSLTPTEFFVAVAKPRALAQTLDGNDNFVPDFTEFAGTYHSKFLQRVAEFLPLFEQRLSERLLEELCPPVLGSRYTNTDAELLGRCDRAIVELRWRQLTVSQAEVCWERFDQDALTKVNLLADHILRTARSGEVTLHGPRVEQTVARELGAVTVRMPLVPNGRTMAVTYAKATDRIRYEVRYTENVRYYAKRYLPTNPTLTDWFSALARDAEARLPWAQMSVQPQVQDSEFVVGMSELMAEVADATGKAKHARRPIFEALLRYGAITSTVPNGPAPAKVLKKLTSRGVLKHLRYVKRDATVGRRYQLSERFRSALDPVKPPS